MDYFSGVRTALWFHLDKNGGNALTLLIQVFRNARQNVDRVFVPSVERGVMKACE
jgi:hypothetical protein